MTQNVGSLDRALRIIAGLALLSMPFVLQGEMRWLGLIGLVPLGTALIGWCPLYGLFGLTTCPLKRT